VSISGLFVAGPSVHTILVFVAGALINLSLICFGSLLPAVFLYANTFCMMILNPPDDRTGRITGCNRPTVLYTIFRTMKSP